MAITVTLPFSLQWVVFIFCIKFFLIINFVVLIYYVYLFAYNTYMKKIKLLTPIALIGVGTLFSPIIYLTSCGNDQSSTLVINEENVKKQTFDTVNDTGPRSITIKGFKLENKRDILGMKIKVLNQSFSPSTLTANIIEDSIREEGLVFDIAINVDIAKYQETVTFDLQFINAKDKQYKSTGYKITLDVID